MLWDQAVFSMVQKPRWRHVVDKLDLLDLYLCASHKRGPLFTSQVQSGARRDAAKLDRVYSSNRGDWFHHVEFLDHDGRQTLSDHIPVVTKIKLHEPDFTRLRKSTYFKCDVPFLDDELLFTKVQEAWGTREEGRDPIDFWSHGWRRIENVLKTEKQVCKN
jgi:hypothetical protein